MRKSVDQSGLFKWRYRRSNLHWTDCQTTGRSTVGRQQYLRGNYKEVQEKGSAGSVAVHHSRGIRPPHPLTDSLFGCFSGDGICLKITRSHFQQSHPSSTPKGCALLLLLLVDCRCHGCGIIRVFVWLAGRAADSGETLIWMDPHGEWHCRRYCCDHHSINEPDENEAERHKSPKRGAIGGERVVNGARNDPKNRLRLETLSKQAGWKE